MAQIIDSQIAKLNGCSYNVLWIWNKAHEKSKKSTINKKVKGYAWTLIFSVQKLIWISHKF